MKHFFICLGVVCSIPALAQLPTSTTKASCTAAGKSDGAVLNMLATSDGGFVALARQGKSWTVQERNGEGGLVREVPLELAYEKEELEPMFLLRTTAGLAVVADGRDGKVYNEWTALFPLDPASLQPGKAELILHGKPGAHNRLYDLRPGGTVSANGAHAVVWRANVYQYYKEPRIYTLQTFDAEYNKVHKWTVKYPDGPGDRFEQVLIDDNGDVYVLAVRDKKPGERKEYGEPSGARSNFELLIYKPGVEEPVTTTLAFTEPVGDVVIHLAKGGVECHGVLQEKSGGGVFTCALDKSALGSGRFAMSRWTTAAVEVKAPTLTSFKDMDMETRWQPRIDLPDGSSVMVAQYEQQTPSTVGAFYAFYALDLLVVRRASNGQLSAVRLPSYQSTDLARVAEPFVTASSDGAVRILVNELEDNLEEGKSLDWYRAVNYGGVLVEWTIGMDMSVSRTMVAGDWEKKESRAVHNAVALSDGRVVLPITSASMYHLPLAKRVCLLTW